jgi:LysM repeat protein
MARYYSRSSRWNRRRPPTGRRRYLIWGTICLVLLGLLWHRMRSSGEPEVVADAATVQTQNGALDKPAGESATPQGLLGLAETPSQGQGPDESSSDVMTLAVPQPAIEPNPTVDVALSEARGMTYSQPSQIVAARDRLNEILSTPMSPRQLQSVKDLMSDLADKWLFNSTLAPGDKFCELYTVKGGDSLEVIGRRFKVPYEILMDINKIRDARSLQAGQRIKVINGPFHAKVYRSTFTLDVYLQDMFVRSFKVGLGAPGSETPTGVWRVQEGGKLVRPEWTDKRTNRTYKPTDPDYPLGSRWIALDGLTGEAKGRTGFAIHGTKDPGQIGTAASQGCIRMYNGQAVLVYNLLYPLYSRVEVVD